MKENFKLIFNEFKQFLSKGDILNLAVGIIIGGSFGKIVSSLVGDIIMPLVGLVMGKVNFTSLFFAMDFNTYDTLAKAKEANAPILLYGNFLQALIDFVIVGFAIFTLVKAVTKARALAEKKDNESPAVPTTKECPECFSQIHIKAKICPHCQSKQGQ